MVRHAWIALWALGIAFTAPCAADEHEPARESPAATEPVLRTDAPPLPAAYEIVLPATSYLGDTLPASVFEANTIPLPAEPLSLRFEDNSTLGRLRRVRSLSLLTFSEQGNSRFFLGVNEEGLLGLHFAASASVANQEPIEVVRLPKGDADDQE